MKISLKFVPEGPTEYNPALVQIMALHQIGDKPLCEPKLTQFTDAYMHYQGTWVASPEWLYYYANATQTKGISKTKWYQDAK